MEPGIYITEIEIEFVAFPQHEIGLAKYCKSFKLKLDDIHLIAISPRLAIDDETLFVLIRSEEHTSELQSPCNLVCRLLLEKKKIKKKKKTKKKKKKKKQTDNYIKTIMVTA